MIEQLNDSNAETLTRSIFQSIHSAYANTDYKGLMANNKLSEKMHEALTEQVFDEAIQTFYSNYGDLVEMKYVGYVSKNVGHQVLWKCSYSDNTEEVLWQLYFSKENTEEHEVTGLWFGY